MEDSESAEKQENTGIGPASAPNRAMSTEVAASSSCAGRSASKTRVNALMTRASIFFAESSYEEGWIAGSSPAMTAVLRFAQFALRPSKRNQQVYKMAAGAISLFPDCYLQ